MATYWVYLSGTRLVTTTCSGIRINMGDNQSMPPGRDNNMECMTSSHEHFAYTMLSAPIMEYLEPAVLELFHHGNELVSSYLKYFGALAH